MNILVLGSGGREHAICWKLKQSPKVKKIYCAPGNGGMTDLAECLDIKSDDISGLLKFAREKKIDLVVVGPEGPLTGGVVDEFTKWGFKIFGPTKNAAQLESSKAFAKDFMHRWNIPTAIYKTFDDALSAKEFLKSAQFPLVVKASGLAAGKGVIICQNFIEAHKAIDDMMVQKIFNDAGNQVVIEECLQGPECSLLAISDGENFSVLETAQDHKRIFDDDIGPNTGGMGAYSPTNLVNKSMLNRIIARIIEPTIRGMRQEGNLFKGVLYTGLMLTSDGPKVLEFNARFGDPEAQAVLPRLKTDFLDLLLASCDGKLENFTLEWDPRACVCVVMASGGYPGKYEPAKEIQGLDSVTESHTIVFHSGTKKDGSKIVTAGGRVLGVTALGRNIEEAIDRAYVSVDKITFEKCFFRRDIGAKAVKKIVGSKK